MRYILLIMFMLVCGNVEATNWCEHANVEGAWLLDESSSDSIDCSSNSRDGTVDVGVGYSATGQFGTGFDFGDETDTLKVSYGTIAMGGWSVLSVVAWVYWDKGGTDEHQVIGNLDAGLTQASFLIRLEPSNDQMEIFVVEQTNNLLSLTPTDIDIPTGEYAHIAFTFEGGDALRAYTNGVLSGDTTSSTDNMDAGSNNNETIQIGTNTFKTADDFAGLIDEPAIFQVELSGTDINDIMDNGLIPVATGTSTKFYN